MENYNDYQFREWLGRTALKDLQTNGLMPKYDIKYTGDYYCVYDAYFTNEYNKRVFVEIKVRDEIYGDYVLEYKKVKSLNYIASSLYLKEDESVFLYINFCKDATYIWNINHYVFNFEKVKWIGMKMNKATSDNRDEKVNKSVVLLDTSNAKKINYKINKKQLIEDEEKRLKPMVEKKKGLFED